jgi:malonyl-CoA O-methyltransferase
MPSLRENSHPGSACFVAEAQGKDGHKRLLNMAVSRPVSAARRRWRLPPPDSVDMLFVGQHMALHELPDRRHCCLVASRLEGRWIPADVLPKSLQPELRSLYARPGWPPAGHELTGHARLGRHAGANRFRRAGDAMGAHHASPMKPRNACCELAEPWLKFHPARFVRRKADLSVNWQRTDRQKTAGCR